MTDIDTIREEHQPTSDAYQWCRIDQQDWPCDTRIVLDALDISSNAAMLCERMADAAEADADRLAEALRECVCTCIDIDGICIRNEALRQHDERVRP